MYISALIGPCSADDHQILLRGQAFLRNIAAITADEFPRCHVTDHAFDRRPRKIHLSADLHRFFQSNAGVLSCRAEDERLAFRYLLCRKAIRQHNGEIQIDDFSFINHFLIRHCIFSPSVN